MSQVKQFEAIRTISIVDTIMNVTPDIEAEERIAGCLKLLADKIFPGMFEVTVPVPSNYPDRKMHLLDLKVWVENNQIAQLRPSSSSR